MCKATEIGYERHWSSLRTLVACYGCWLWSWEGWGTRPRKNSEIHIDVSHSRQPLVKGERLVRYEVNTVIAVSVNKDKTRSVDEQPRSLPCQTLTQLEVNNLGPFLVKHPHNSR